ncbi:hypothetical protein LB505_006674 [Fusarium chuoi]|nr:hypothetical protein LB505_006674 [Fusarium chuoi]
MRMIKPSWLSHSGEQKDFEVYSCHVSPDGKRLATAGGDGHVRVWSTESIYNADTPKYNKPRQLCHMSHHLGTIHSRTTKSFAYTTWIKDHQLLPLAPTSLLLSRTGRHTND